MPRTKKNPAEAETTPVTAVEETKPAEEKAAKKTPSILKKAAAKKPAEKAEKTEKAEKKSPALLKKEKVEEVYLQIGGSEWDVSACKAKAVEAYVAQGHRASSVKKLVVYLKPEEGKAYYVINDDVTGSIDL